MWAWLAGSCCSRVTHLTVITSCCITLISPPLFRLIDNTTISLLSDLLHCLITCVSCTSPETQKMTAPGG